MSRDQEQHNRRLELVEIAKDGVVEHFRNALKNESDLTLIGQKANIFGQTALSAFIVTQFNKKHSSIEDAKSLIQEIILGDVLNDSKIKGCFNPEDVATKGCVESFFRNDQATLNTILETNENTWLERHPYTYSHTKGSRSNQYAKIHPEQEVAPAEQEATTSKDPCSWLSRVTGFGGHSR